MSYIDNQFNIITSDKDHVIKLKLSGKDGSTHWLDITEQEADFIHRLLKSNNYDERASAK